MIARILTVLVTGLLIISSPICAQFENVEHVQKFKKSSNAIQLAKSKRVSYGIWFNPAKWQLTQNFNNSAEFSFGLKGKDAYAFMINEGIKVPMDAVTDFIINDFTKKADSFSVIHVEDRIVNGMPVKYLKIDANVNGLDINYMIYIHCGEEETVQIYAYAYGKNLLELEDFLNGFAKTNKIK